MLGSRVPTVCRSSCCQVWEDQGEIRTDANVSGQISGYGHEHFPWLPCPNSGDIYYAASEKTLSGNSEPDRIADQRHKECVGQLVQKPPIFFRGAYYEGQWHGDLRHGHGKLERVGFGCYRGQFVDDRATGNGHFVKVNGDVYDGQWLNDRAHGWGNYVNADGSTYRGYWKSDQKFGAGMEVWTDGSIYEGEYHTGKKHGRGIFLAFDSSRYEGQFREDMMSGDGLYKFADGRVYSGQWSMSSMSGEGRMVWPDGRMYEGQYEDDKKSGTGVFSWPDGRSYSGQWFRGKQHGLGVVKDRKGRQLKGTWIFGEKQETTPSKELSRRSARSNAEETPEVRRAEEGDGKQSVKEFDASLAASDEASAPTASNPRVIAALGDEPPPDSTPVKRTDSERTEHDTPVDAVIREDDDRLYAMV